MFALLVAAPMLWAPPTSDTRAASQPPPLGTLTPYSQPRAWVPPALPPSHPSLMIPMPEGKPR